MARLRRRARALSGRAAGQTVLALEADGTVKGCPSLATVGFAGGNVRDMSLDDIWHHSEGIHFGRLRSVDDLWGYCRGCYYNDICRGGCTWTSHSLLGKPGNNPYCHYRALELEKQGLRERIVKLQDAAPASFAVGRFDLITEDIASGQEVSRISCSGQVIALTWKTRARPRRARAGRRPSWRCADNANNTSTRTRPVVRTARPTSPPPSATTSRSTPDACK